ncbi:hypothetical protein L2E82_01285 [Cichorium intybus]|uniref:Uncharacterized protein n=1 Tax=Cichorium intybus TaxID=13427 RepID=A0ACB9H0M2_CICIN|nr:hypothetical protein L2E82_01285 [Cichorium intybus]
MVKHLLRTLKSLPRNPKSTISVSHFHTCKKTLISNTSIDFILDEFADLPSSNPVKTPTQGTLKVTEPVDVESSSIKSSHQWPEWVGLMPKLMKNGYFDVDGNPSQIEGLIDGKACNQIRTAYLSFHAKSSSINIVFHQHRRSTRH